jgi:uncharacterized protein
MATGDICHIEFPSTDMEKTKSFFTEIFHWSFESMPGFDTYMGFRTPSGLGGGVDSSKRAEAPINKGPILHLEVEDIDATLSKIAAMGGKIVVEKTKISDEFGSYAVFLDNVGNRFGLWSP